MTPRNSFLTISELEAVGFASFGENVSISRHAAIYRPESIHLGNNVRIDDFCVISGGAGIFIGNYIHISAATQLYGGGTITIQDYCSISSRCALYSQSDDFSGATAANPTLPPEIPRNVLIAPVTLERHALIGTGCTILPGVTVGEGAAVGAHSLVLKNLDGWAIHAGSPAKLLRPRSKDLLIAIEPLNRSNPAC